jgi:hypothetical protein
MAAMLSTREKLGLLLGKHSLKHLIEACPDIWRETGTEINQRLAGLSGAARGGAPGEVASTSLNAYMRELNDKAEAWKRPLAASRNNLGMVDRAFRDIIKSRMAWMALQNYYLAALGGQAKGTIRFNWLNGTLLQRLLFRQGFERKPVSLFWFSLVWPLISQKKILMRLVYRKGIYCFYSRRLVGGLAKLARTALAGLPPAAPDRSQVLEIAAGDGTLSRFLSAAGVPCLATDDLSWDASARAVKELPAGSVEALDAVDALRRHRPAVVFCSWPPAGNQFERQVFQNPDTRLYVVIGSRHQFASGNWHDYLHWAEPVGPGVVPTTIEETAGGDTRPFTLELSPELSRAVLPRELDNAVLIFRRKS